MPEPVQALEFKPESLGTEITLECGLPTNNLTDVGLKGYIFKKEASALTAGEITACQEFVLGTGNKSADIDVYHWFDRQEDQNDTTRIRTLFDRNARNNNRYSEIITWCDNEVQAGKVLIKAVHTSNTAATIITEFEIDSIVGVWLEDDTREIRDYYATGSSFAGQIITLVDALPAANTNVYVMYNAVYQDAIEYHYTVCTYLATDTPVWSTSESVSGYCEFDANVMTADPKQWVFDAMIKVLRNNYYDKETQLQVLMSYPQFEAISKIYIWRTASQSAEKLWADKYGNTMVQTDHHSFKLVTLQVGWITHSNPKLRDKLTQMMSNSMRTIERHITRQVERYGGHPITIEEPGDDDATYNDALYHTGSMTISIPLVTVSIERDTRPRPSTVTYTFNQH